MQYSSAANFAAQAAGAAMAYASSGGRKRRPSTSDGTSQQSRPMHHVGGLNMQYRKGTCRTSEKKQVKGRIQRLLIEHKLKETSFIARFQKLTNGLYSGEGGRAIRAAYALDKQWQGGTPGAEEAGQYMNLPVYAFNLSTLPLATVDEPTDISYTAPFYRLAKLKQASAVADATNQNYYWFTQKGQKRLNPDEPSAIWQLEQIKGNPAIDTKVIRNDHYMWKWSDIEIAFAGSGLAPRRVHMALCRFKNPAAGPRRHYGAHTDPASYDVYQADPKIVCASDLWWDKWLARKTVHPLRPTEAMHTSNVVDFLTYQCICLEPKENQHGANVWTQKMFHTANKLMYAVDPSLAETNHEPDINTGPSGAFIKPKYNKDNKALTQGSFPAKYADTWLMIWAEDYDMPKPLFGGGEPNLSFDLMIRGKYALTRF